MIQSNSVDHKTELKHYTLFLIGMVISGITYSQELVNYTTVDVECLNTISLQENQLVINSQAQYQRIRNNRFDGRKFGIDCKGLPIIDFDKYTLIGYLVQTGGCTEPDFSLEFTTSGQSEYTLTCYTSNTGACRRMWSEFYWIVTQKIKPNESIKFELVYK